MSNLLSISIPSYKRPNLLKKCLLTLAPQCMSASVSLNVYDDSCDDTNSKVYLELSSQFPCLTVVYNAENLGIDENIDRCISYACTDYVWVIGEDDLVVDGAIDRVVTILRAHQPICLFVNYQYVNDDYTTRNSVAVSSLTDGYYPAGQFFSEYGWSTGFLGSIIVNKKYWSKDCKKFRGTYFNHVGKIFSKIRPSDDILAISDPLVHNRAESLASFSWLKDFFLVHSGFNRMTQLLSLENPEWTKASHSAVVGFNRRFNYPSIRVLFSLRALGAFNKRDWYIYLRSSRLAIIYLLVAVIPEKLIKTPYAYFRTLRKFFTSILNRKK